MAVPETFEKISSNLPIINFLEVMEAIVKGEVRQVHNSHTLFIWLRTWKIDFEGSRYKVSEAFETLTSVELESAKPDTMRLFLDNFEKELDLAVQKRDFTRAEYINNQIKGLERLNTH